MQTSLDCVPCFFKQALDAARFAGARLSVQKKILQALAQEILRFDLRLCPSEMGRILYKLVRKISAKEDPFQEIKQKSNRFALALYPRLKRKVTHSKDRLLTAVELAIAGNIIDYGVKSSLSIAQEIEKVLIEENRVISCEAKHIFSYRAFRRALKAAKRILYLGDNAGEVVFDRILIEELKNQKKDIIYAVRGEPIINDALMEDALFCGIDKYARVISTGCDAPGTILTFCTKEFRKIYRDAEFIISKGQGNFEALADEKRPIFFLFRAKCAVVAKHLGCRVGDVILTRT